MHESGLSGSLLRTVIGFSTELGRDDSEITLTFSLVVVGCDTAAVDGATTAAGNEITAGRTDGCDGAIAMFVHVGKTVAEGRTMAAFAISCGTAGIGSTRDADAGIDWTYVCCCMGLPTILTSRPSAVRDNSCNGAVASNPASDGCGLINWAPTRDGESEVESFSVSVSTLDISVKDHNNY